MGCCRPTFTSRPLLIEAEFRLFLLWYYTFCNDKGIFDHTCIQTEDVLYKTEEAFLPFTREIEYRTANLNLSGRFSVRGSML